jgi:ribA/ribD-fused uncharacterized protein
MNPFESFAEAYNSERNFQRDLNKNNKGYVFFWKANEEFGVFSQWYKSDFIYDGITFKSAEQYMMYRKALLFGDTKIADEILKTPEEHPNFHRELGRRVANFDERVWSVMSMRVVVDGNFRKFSQNTELMKMLLDTDERMIVETSPHDRVWGVGFDAATAWMNENKWGENRLGKCLMIVRDMLAPITMFEDVFTKGFPLTGSLTVLCYFCLSALKMESKTRARGVPDVDGIAITTCESCMKKYVLAYGEVDVETVTKMIKSVSERSDIVTLEDAKRVPLKTEIDHPDMIKLYDTSSCKITKVPGCKDEGTSSLMGRSMP